MQAASVVFDSDACRLRVVAGDPSATGLFKLQTAVEQLFPGAEISATVRVPDGLCFTLAGYQGEHNPDTLDSATFNRIVGTFDPVVKVAEAGPFEVQAMLNFEPSQVLCDQLTEFMREGASLVAKSPLHRRLLSITVDDLNGDSEHALTVDDIDNELERLLCCCGRRA